MRYLLKPYLAKFNKIATALCRKFIHLWSVMQELMVLVMFMLFDLLQSLVRLRETFNYYSKNSMLRALVYTYEGYYGYPKKSWNQQELNYWPTMNYNSIFWSSYDISFTCNDYVVPKLTWSYYILLGSLENLLHHVDEVEEERIKKVIWLYRLFPKPFFISVWIELDI